MKLFFFIKKKKTLIFLKKKTKFKFLKFLYKNNTFFLVKIHLILIIYYLKNILKCL